MSYKAGLSFKYPQPEFAEEEPLEKIQLKHLILPYVLLGVGSLTALLVFVSEIVHCLCKFAFTTIFCLILVLN